MNIHISLRRMCNLAYSSLCITGLSLHAHTTNICPVPTAYSIRSQGQNEARAQAGLTNQVHQPSDTNYGTLAITPAVTRSFSPGHITVPLFGRDLHTGNSIGISGSQADTQTPKDWLADYFFFPKKASGSVSFTPRIQNVLVDFDFFWGLDSWAPGLFCRIQTPVVWSKWELNPCPNTTSFSSESPFETFAGLTNASSATVAFDKHFCLEYAPTSTYFTIQPLRAAKLCSDCEQTRSECADVHLDIGWNFLMEQEYHLGIFFRCVAPTGNRPQGRFFFEPIIGNGHRVEVGGGLTGNCILWQSHELEHTYLDLAVHADITHMCATHGSYVFDLCNKPFSRYMLAGKISGPNSISELAPLANLTLQDVNVQGTTQADIVTMLTLTADTFDWTIGYNFWATGCRTIQPRSTLCTSACTNLLEREQWALVALEKKDNKYTAVDNVGDIHAIVPDTSGSPLTPLTKKDIDFAATNQKGWSNTLFTHLNFSWYNHERWTPYIGTGAQIEFGDRDTYGTKGNNCFVAQCMPCCRRLALYQWGIWIKGGVSF